MERTFVHLDLPAVRKARVLPFLSTLRASLTLIAVRIYLVSPVSLSATSRVDNVSSPSRTVIHVPTTLGVFLSTARRIDVGDWV